MKNWLLWMLLFFSGFCLNGVAAATRLQNDLLIVSPAPPHDDAFRRSMMKKIREIATTDLDDRNISRLMGWPEAKRMVFDGGQTRFEFHIYEFSYPTMTLEANKQAGRFSFSLEPNYICLTGDDVVAEFGKEFKRSMINRDTFSDFEDKSYYKSENFARFGSGPVYEWLIGNVKTLVKFSFDVSECSTDVFIARKVYGYGK